MKKYSGWGGTNDEINYLVKAILQSGDPSIADSFPELKERELKSLFCAALASNIVTNELAGQMQFHFENGEDGSENRKKLDELLAKYAI